MFGTNNKKNKINKALLFFLLEVFLLFSFFVYLATIYSIKIINSNEKLIIIIGYFIYAFLVYIALFLIISSALYQLNKFIFCLFYVLKNKQTKNKILDEKLIVNSRILFLIVTCNDFCEESVYSIINQSLLPKDYKIVICDDSKKDESIRKIDDFVKKINNNNLIISRRDFLDRGKNSKQGNSNFFLRKNFKNYDYVITLDADEILEKYFVLKMVSKMLLNDKIGLLQATESFRYDTSFSYLLTPFQTKEYNYLNCNSTAINNLFIPFYIGHSAIIRMDVLEKLNGFSENFMSEDKALSIEILDLGYLIEMLPTCVSNEQLPPTFYSFKKRLFRWTYGDYKLFKGKKSTILKSKNMKFSKKISFLIENASLSFVPVLTLLIFVLLSIMYFLPHQLIPFDSFTIFIISMVLTFLPIFLMLLLSLSFAINKNKKNSYRILINFLFYFLIGPSLLITMVWASLTSYFGFKLNYYVTARKANKINFWLAIKENKIELICGLICLILYIVPALVTHNYFAFYNIFLILFVISCFLTVFVSMTSNLKLKSYFIINDKLEN